MIKNIVLIDADSLCYLGKTTDTLLQIIEKVDYKIQAILDETNADYYALFISQGKYFRHALKDSSEESGSYKSNRKYSNQNYNRVIKEYLIAQYGAVSSSGIEADDYISLLMNKKLYLNNLVGGNYKIDTFVPDSFTLVNSEECNIIMVAVDKDLLQSIPSSGRGHLNYNKKISADEWGMEWIETSVLDSWHFKFGQLIIGDASDGVTGIPKKGEKYWEKMVAENKDGLDDIFIEYLSYYGQAQGIYEFQKNYRLLHLLDTDEDWMREVGYTPELPSFKQVIKQNVEIKNEF